MNAEQDILVDGLGRQFGDGLRTASGYKKTQSLGLTDEALNRTPPVGLNLQLIAQMKSISQLRTEFAGQSVDATMLGIAIAEGVPDFGRFIQSILGANWSSMSVLDIDSTILDEITALEILNVQALHCDARQTELVSGSQNLLILDHLGNCCPPTFDRVINEEAARILRPSGIALVNITTSDVIRNSPDREVIDHDKLVQLVGAETVSALQEEVYDLTQLKSITTDNSEDLRGNLLEIEPGGSFVVFGEDEHGHGEWFRSLDDHTRMWKKNGFELVEIATREGRDSHEPPLLCKRHNVILRKIQE